LNLLRLSGVGPGDMEALGEKALPQGHIDILIKERTPLGSPRIIAVEVKMGQARPEHVEQLWGYKAELGPDCIGGALIVGEVPTKVHQVAQAKGIAIVRYHFDLQDEPLTFAQLCGALKLEMGRQ